MESDSIYILHKILHFCLYSHYSADFGIVKGGRRLYTLDNAEEVSYILV